MKTGPIKKFYDDLSADYHKIFKDWDKSIKDQAIALNNIIKEYAKPGSVTLLDCSCGIGTQAIGLARLGYKVTATDLSPRAIERAREEALNRGVKITFDVADLLQLEKLVAGFDVVISCDNSLPHLLSEKDLRMAAKNIMAKMNSGGLFIASTRDYDEILKQKPISTFPIVTEYEDGKIFSFQVWNWMEDNIYTVDHFTIQGTPENYTTALRKVQYKAYRRTEISTILEKQGFTKIKWLMPAETDYYQPIVLAFKP
jgi:glycine/sarcosine N-methyltransferase